MDECPNSRLMEKFLELSQQMAEALRGVQVEISHLKDIATLNNDMRERMAISEQDRRSIHNRLEGQGLWLRWAVGLLVPTVLSIIGLFIMVAAKKL